MPNDDTYRELEGGAWAHPIPTECPCHGSGWMLSDYDTFHRCPLHGTGVPHPEDEAGHEGYDPKAHHRNNWVAAWRIYQDDARRLGLQGRFSDAVARYLGGRPDTAEAWVRGAARMVGSLDRTLFESESRRMGFSCGLERRLAEEAEAEWRGDRW